MDTFKVGDRVVLKAKVKLLQMNTVYTISKVYLGEDRCEILEYTNANENEHDLWWWTWRFRKIINCLEYLKQ